MNVANLSLPNMENHVNKLFDSLIQIADKEKRIADLEYKISIQEDIIEALEDENKMLKNFIQF